MTYFMESARESQRLELKIDVAAAHTELWNAGLRPGMAALDVGCGTGGYTRTIARIAAPGTVIGIDLSAARLAEARELADAERQPVVFREGSAYALPLPDASVDFAWSRFLFEYLDAPRRALAELRRVTRPGGTVAVADLDGQIAQFYPLPPEVRTGVEDGLRILGETGFDPLVGRKLFHWFVQEDFGSVAVSVVPYQVYAGSLTDRDRANWQIKIATATAHLARHTGDRQRWSWLHDQLLAALERPDVFYYSTLVTVRGVVI